MEERDKNTAIRTSEQSIQQSPERKSMWMGDEEKNAHKHLMTHLQYVILKRVDSIMFDFSCALDYTRRFFARAVASVTNLLCYIFCRLCLQATNSKWS